MSNKEVVKERILRALDMLKINETEEYYEIEVPVITFFNQQLITLRLYVTDDGLAVILVNGKDITIITGVDSTVSVTDEDAVSINIIGYANGCVFYYDLGTDNTNIKYISYSNAVAGSDVEIYTLASVSVVEEDVASFDLGEQDYMYFYNKTGDNYYLNRIRVNNNIDEKEEMFGVYNKADVPEVEVEEEVEDEE